MKKPCLLFLCVIAGMFVRAQTATVHYTEKDYARNPVWIQMIDDTTTNYFEAEKAFDIYFRHHEKPGDEEDVIGSHEEREKHPSKKEMRKMNAENKMRMEVKKYERWHDRMFPYVQEDGRILTPTERLQLWQQQKLKNNK